MKCRKCDKEATYKAETIFGWWSFCGRHIKKYRNHICVRTIKPIKKV